MFSIRPGKRWFEFGDEPLEGPPGFRMNADGTGRDASPGDLRTAFLGLDPGDTAALPGGAMFDIQPEQDLPGLHNFRPPAELVPGFRMNADGSIRDASTPPARFYPEVGGNPFGVFGPQGLAYTPVGNGSPPHYLADDAKAYTYDLPLGATPSPSLGLPIPGEGSLPASFSYVVNPDGRSRDALAPGVSQASEGSPAVFERFADPNIFRVGDGAASAADGSDGLELAQAQTEDQQTQKATKTSPGVAVVLPDGSTIPNAKSPTGHVMSPVADLSSVAAAGRNAGFIHHAMLTNVLTAPGAPAFMIWALRENLRQGGALDYQRQDGNFLGQFTPVSNINVGLFAQQAGLTLEQTLTVAGLYARWKSSNAQPDQPYGLHPDQLEFITMGYKIGERGLFGRPAIP